MALDIIVGDLFTQTLDRDVIIAHGCNSHGVMGYGVAKIVKDLYPAAFRDYYDVHKQTGLHVGQVIISEGKIGKPTIAHLITQEHYGRDNKMYITYDAVVVACQAVAKFAKSVNKEVHIPLIGGGLGGGDPRRLIAIFQGAFRDVNATLWLQE